MRYFSVCSGIESASVAWSALAWTPVPEHVRGDASIGFVLHDYEVAYQEEV